MGSPKSKVSTSLRHYTVGMKLGRWCKAWEKPNFLDFPFALQMIWCWCRTRSDSPASVNLRTNVAPCTVWPILNWQITNWIRRCTQCSEFAQVKFSCSCGWCCNQLCPALRSAFDGSCALGFDRSFEADDGAEPVPVPYRFNLSPARNGKCNVFKPNALTTGDGPARRMIL